MPCDPSRNAGKRLRLGAEVGLCLLAGSFLFPACGKKESGFVAETVDGVRIVRNLAVKPGRPLGKLRATETLALGEGGAEDEGLFYSPADIDADRGGGIYVLDGRDALIKYFNGNGRLERIIGRKGQGPGEFEAPGAMEIQPDGGILVVDMSQMRLTLFAPDGRFERSTVLRNFVQDISVAPDGKVVALYRDSASSRQCAGVLDTKTGELTALIGQETYWPARIMNNVLRYDFPYFIGFAVSPTNRLIAGSAVAYEISVMDLRGRLEMVFKKDADRVPVEGEMLARIGGLTLKEPNPYVRNPYFPFFASLAVDEQGRIWVRHYLPNFVGRTNPETPYDIFSPDGVFLFEVRLPGHVASRLVFKNGFAYALKRRDSGEVVPVRLLIEQ